MMLEEPVRAPQYNLDGYMLDGRLHVLGIVDAVMYPGTQAFMRFELPSRSPAPAGWRHARPTWHSASSTPSASGTACSTWSSSTTRRRTGSR